MISKININTNPNNNPSSSSKSPSFKAGPLEGVSWLLQQCNTYPMVGVSVIDATTAILPRTVVDAKTNGFAAAETFRRESSGLVVNCLIPGFFVLGAAKAFESFNSGYKGLNLPGLWANEDSLTELHKRYTKAGNVDKYVDGIFKDMHINVGKDWKDLNPTDERISKASKLVKEIINGENGKTKKDLKEVYKLIIDDAHGAEHIKFSKEGKPFATNLTTFLRDTVDCGSAFKKLKPPELEGFLKKAVRFANLKSVAGLALVIPLAASMQSINRWITRKASGKEGAPIYKDFIDDDKKKLNNKDQSSFWGAKIGAAGLMVGVAVLSMMKKPSMKMLQFNNILPSMDQCRWIATATFASRMLASEDKNELREATFRDIATFCSLYFFGDYVSKGVGSLINKTSKGKINLMNEMSEAPKSNSPLKKFKHWVTETKLKSFDEAAKISPKAKDMRALCEISSLGFSMLLLGILVPWYVRKQTEIKHKKELEVNNKKFHSYPTIFHNSSENRVFQAFGMINPEAVK